ncbi:MAG: hypothetical protein RL077_1162 [Verrucomicrobiota bacterium]|jgi:hypothetical protein
MTNDFRVSFIFFRLGGVFGLGVLPVGCDSTTGSAARPPAAEPRSLGLRVPTAEERARLDAIAPPNPPQIPNELARQRLNAERVAKGLAPLPEAVPPSVQSNK